MQPCKEQLRPLLLNCHDNIIYLWLSTWSSWNWGPLRTPLCWCRWYRGNSAHSMVLPRYILHGGVSMSVTWSKLEQQAHVCVYLCVHTHNMHKQHVFIVFVCRNTLNHVWLSTATAALCQGSLDVWPPADWSGRPSRRLSDIPWKHGMSTFIARRCSRNAPRMVLLLCVLFVNF